MTINLDDIKPGDTITLEHSSGDRLSGIASDDPGYFAVDNLDVSDFWLPWFTANGWQIIDHKPAVTLPTAEGWYEDVTGVVWHLVEEDERFVQRWFLNGEFQTNSNVAKFAPFTHLVPEGSERDATARKVIDYVKSIAQFYEGTDEEAHFEAVLADARQHFGLSGEAGA